MRCIGYARCHGMTQVSSVLTTGGTIDKNYFDAL
jgi:hypothetical protein